MDYQLLSRPLGTSVGGWLIDNFADRQWTNFRGVSAFLKRSGAKHLTPALYDFTRRRGTSAAVAVGIDAGGTSLEGFQDVWRVLTGGHGSFLVVHEGQGGQGIFHPKTFAFSNATHVSFVVGSSNLTEGGLFVNHEAAVAITMPRNSNPSALEQQLEITLGAWLTPSPWCLEVTPQLISDLYLSGDLPSEAVQRVVSRAAAGALHRAGGASASSPRKPFGTSASTVRPAPRGMPPGLPKAPVVPSALETAIAVATLAQSKLPALIPPQAGSPQFYIEVRPHHNGELFLSYLAVHDDPAFFGHPFTGWTTPKRAGNAPYPQLDPDPVVEIIIYDTRGGMSKHKNPHPLNVVDYALKREIRITIPDGLHNHIPTMSVLAITKDPAPALDYRLEFYPPSTVPSNISSRLTNVLPSGGQPTARRYGWS